MNTQEKTVMAIFEEFPALKKKIPYVSLGEFPTPIKRLDRLGKEIGIGRLYLKHDGVSGPIYGGNKVRKLEFLLGDALHKRAKEVLTFGCAGSNHALATAIYARELGLRCISILLAQPNAQYVRDNLLLSHAYGAEIHHCRNRMAAYVPTFVKLFIRRLSQGKFPYVIPPGGSSPVGVVGYVSAGFELKHQIAGGLMPEPDKIFLPLGTMGTAMGLMLGLRAAGLKSRVVCVRVVDRKLANRGKFIDLFRKTVVFIRSVDPSFPQVEIAEDEIDIRHDFFGGQYARFTEQGMAAVDLVARYEGIRLEGTYTGKAMAALIDQARTDGFRDKVILFWNTYNARDFSSAIKGIDYHQLPHRFHRYFEQELQPLDKRHSK